MKKRREKEYVNFTTRDIDGTHALGVVVVCDLFGVKERRADLLAKFKAAGVNESYLLEKREKSAFIKSVRALEESEILVKVSESNDEIIYQCNTKSVTDNGQWKEADVQKTALVKFYKTGPNAGTVDSDTHGIAIKVYGMLVEEMQTANTSEVSKAIRRCIDREADAVNLTKSGNTWFVPTNFVSLVEKIQNLVNQLSGENLFSVLPVADKAENRASYWKAITGEIDRQVEEIVKAQEELTKKVQDTGETPKYEVANIMSLIRERKQRLESYAGLFSGQAETITDKLNNLEAGLRQAFGAI